MTARLLLALAVWIAAAAPATAAETRFTLDAAAEVVASITASCGRCDWGKADREAAFLEVSLDGSYSQHLLLTHSPAHTYRIMLGRLAPGRHQLTVRHDSQRSARRTGLVNIGTVAVQSFTEGAREFDWLARAPFLRARPGTVERFTDLPILSYAEADVARGEDGSDYRFQYTTIFSNEDGGTPPDRLMATWGRTTDIEFVLGVTTSGAEVMQADGHTWAPYRGKRFAGHPELWVATANNMVSDHGDSTALRFGLAPELVVLAGRSRETVMDQHPWAYAFAAAEMHREKRVDQADAPGPGSVANPSRYAVVEACATVSDAVIALDLGVADKGTTHWFASDARDERFKIARGGCFRGGAALPGGISTQAITGVRIRAYQRLDAPGVGRVELHGINRVFMLDETGTPVVQSLLHWAGNLAVPIDGQPLTVPFASGP